MALSPYVAERRHAEHCRVAGQRVEVRGQDAERGQAPLDQAGRRRAAVLVMVEIEQAIEDQLGRRFLAREDNQLERPVGRDLGRLLGQLQCRAIAPHPLHPALPTGLPRSRPRTPSRQIVSEATAEPPGLSMRNRIAPTSASRNASRKARATSRALISTVPVSGLAALPPWVISPVP